MGLKLVARCRKVLFKNCCQYVTSHNYVYQTKKMACTHLAPVGCESAVMRLDKASVFNPGVNLTLSGLFAMLILIRLIGGAPIIRAA